MPNRAKYAKIFRNIYILFLLRYRHTIFDAGNNYRFVPLSLGWEEKSMTTIAPTVGVTRVCRPGGTVQAQVGVFPPGRRTAGRFVINNERYTNDVFHCLSHDTPNFSRG